MGISGDKSIRSHTALRTSRHWTKLKTPSNMAPTTSSRLVARDCDRVDIYGNCYYSTWDNWGRWVALVLIVLFFLFLGLAFSCISQRRRRRRGLAPMYGTGWMGGKHNGAQQHQQYGNNSVGASATGRIPGASAAVYGEPGDGHDFSE